MPISDDLAQLQPLLSRGYDCHLSPEVAREIAGIVSDYHDNREELDSAFAHLAQLHCAAGDTQYAMTPADLEGRLAASVQSELARFEKEHGFQPAEIEVRMTDASSVEDRWRRYRLTQIECRY